MTTHTRTTISVLAAIGLASTAALTGCGTDKAADTKQASSSSSSAAERGPITFAMGKNDTDKLKPVIDEWNKQHPKEKVTLKELAGEADAQHDTLVQALQAKSSDYDVMALDVVWTAEFAAHQWLAPLEGDLKVDTSKLLKSTVKSATYGGKLYAMPQNTNGQLLFRNTELAPTAPKTFKELGDECTKLPSGKDCLITQLKQYEGLTVNAAGFIEGWGGHIVKADGKTPVVTDAEAKEGLQALVDAYKAGVVSKASTGANEETTFVTFVSGQSAFAINWPYMYAKAESDASSKVKGKVAVQPLVGKDGVGVSTLGGYNNGISAFSKHKATARDFVQFITSEKVQKQFAEHAFPPVLASVYDDKDLVAKFPYLPALKQSLEHAVPRPVSPFYPAISKAIQDNAYAAINGEKSVDQAASDMAAAINQAAH